MSRKPFILNFGTESDTSCKSESQCRIINQELDEANYRLQNLRREYGSQLQNFKKDDDMYMLNPGEGPQSSQVHYSPEMYSKVLPVNSIQQKPRLIQPLPNKMTTCVADPAAKYGRINPNFPNRYRPDEQRFTMLTPNEPVRKRDLVERQKLKIYPHMYDTYGMMERDRKRSDEELQSMLYASPSVSLTGGVDYPIPMRYQLRPLMSPENLEINRKDQVGGIDYDLRVPCNLTGRRESLPKWSDPDRKLVQVSYVDSSSEPYARDSQIDYTSILKRDCPAPLPTRKPWTVGAPGADRETSRCAQRRRNEKQIQDILRQQHYQPKKEAKCVNNELSKSEKFVFGSAKINSPKIRAPKYPNNTMQKSGFFDIAIPPPNPMLLSNLPSSQLAIKNALTGIPPSSIAISDQLSSNTVENFSGMASDTQYIDELQPSKVIAASKAIRREIGSAFGAEDVGAHQINSGYDPTRPPPAASLSSPEVTEFQVARSPKEKEMKHLIEKTLEQESTALMQIADLRHNLAGLEQRVVQARAQNRPQDIAEALQHKSTAQDTIQDLRRMIKALRERREAAVSELQPVLTNKEFGSYRTLLANQTRLMEVKVRQYYQQPEPNVIEAFLRPHFGGKAYSMKPGFYDAPKVGGIGANRLNSLKIGDNVMVRLYQYPRRQGKMISYSGPRRIGLMPTLWSNAVSGIEIIEKSANFVHLWDAPFFQGGHVRLSEGFFDYPSVGGIQATKLASLQIPEDLQVQVFSRPEGKGESVTFMGPQKIAFLPADWNSKVMGLRISKK